MAKKRTSKPASRSRARPKAKAKAKPRRASARKPRRTAPDRLPQVEMVFGGLPVLPERGLDPDR